MERHFFMHFNVPFQFFKVPFYFPQFQNQHFASKKRIGVPPKEEKCHFFFPLMERDFFMHFYVTFDFFKVPFDFASLPKPAFCKAKVHRRTPKEEKSHFLFSPIEWYFLYVVLRAISFYQSLFRFWLPLKSSIF